jgi:hypothetical protein
MPRHGGISHIRAGLGVRKLATEAGFRRPLSEGGVLVSPVMEGAIWNPTTAVGRRKAPATIRKPTAVRNLDDERQRRTALDRSSHRNQFPEFLSVLNAMDSDFHFAVRPHLSAMPTLGYQSNGRGRVQRSRSNVTQDHDRFGDGCRSSVESPQAIPEFLSIPNAIDNDFLLRPS